MIAAACLPSSGPVRSKPERRSRLRAACAIRLETWTFDLGQSYDAASAVHFIHAAMERGVLRCRKLLLALAIMIATSVVATAQATDRKPPQPEQDQTWKKVNAPSP
jgi:hypothetical protein